MLKNVRVLTWHLLPGFYLADSRAILEQNTEIDKESLALFARNERPHDDIEDLIHSTWWDIQILIMRE